MNKQSGLIKLAPAAGVRAVTTCKQEVIRPATHGEGHAENARQALHHSAISDKIKGPRSAALVVFNCAAPYKVDSISKPHASRRGSGMYFEFLLRRAHSRKRVERRYWSGESLYSRTTCSNSVMVGTIGPIGSGLPQFGFPRRLAMKLAFPTNGGIIR